jgi:hypothetical protein
MQEDIEMNSGVSNEEKQIKLKTLKIQGSSLSDLCLYFSVPGT